MLEEELLHLSEGHSTLIEYYLILLNIIEFQYVLIFIVIIWCKLLDLFSLNFLTCYKIVYRIHALVCII